jgi:hypothetical protein
VRLPRGSPIAHTLVGTARAVAFCAGSLPVPGLPLARMGQGTAATRPQSVSPTSKRLVLPWSESCFSGSLILGEVVMEKNRQDIERHGEQARGPQQDEIRKHGAGPDAPRRDGEPSRDRSRSADKTERDVEVEDRFQATDN